MTVLLLGTDFSTESDRALRRAVLLARQAGYELLIVAVREDDEQLEDPQAQQKDASVLLRQMQRTIASHDGVRCDIELRTGRPSEQLAEAAREAGAAVMVIGPHRSSLIRDAFDASTAERIVQHSPVPLICANGVPSAPYRRLLVPVDLEDVSRRAVEAVRRLDIAGEADVVLLHVYDAEAREMLGRALVTADERRRYLSERAADAQEELRAFARSAEMEHTTLLVHETCGSLTKDVEQVASEELADLIVLSRSHKGTVAKAILGSLTEDLFRSSQIDVLVVPEPQ